MTATGLAARDLPPPLAEEDPPDPPAVAGAARPGPRLVVARTALVVLAAVALGFTLQATAVGAFEHRATQVHAYDRFRERLALGTAPLGPTDGDGRLLAPGTAVALLEIPSLHLRQVVGEGTSSGVLAAGPGHRRDTALPGQRGMSVVYGRAHAYGGPFRRIGSLKRGDRIRVVTGQGAATYRVIGRREGGDRLPPDPKAGRLVLVTAAGTPLAPSGVLRVDADLVGDGLPRPAVPALARPGPSEDPLGTDASTAWALVLWLEALVAAALGAVWSWRRWGRQQTWIVFTPVVLAVALGVGGQAMRLLPNLL